MLKSDPPPRVDDEAPPNAPQDDRDTKAPRRRGDLIFNGVSGFAGGAILILLGAVAAFLIIRSLPAMTATTEQVSAAAPFTVYGGEELGFWGFAGRALFGTVLAAVMALILAVPFAVAIGLFISHYAPRKLSIGLGYIIDLLAAIPSVVFGLWGMLTLEQILRPAYEWIDRNIGWVLERIAGRWETTDDGEEVLVGGLPGFNYMAENFEWWPISPDLVEFTMPGRNVTTGAIVLAIMILPIITSLCREVFLQTPRLQEEASLALGATRWEMIKMTVLPFGRSGIVSASMLGLGRALGETMALLMVISPGLMINFNLLQSGQHSTIASNIAQRFPEASIVGEGVTGQEVLIGIGLMLFVLTFVINFISRWIVNRYAEFSGANA